uniref:TYR_PHOSPHATASE_2 domain-containing protein n=1 Tax=Panagrellus redivivus TaxID=6233 RepID=A0A7E4VZU9_PANRE
MATNPPNTNNAKVSIDHSHQRPLQPSNAKPTYSLIRTNIIRITPESMQCKLYCRGPACKYCSPTGWSEADQAIRGLYSSWVTDEMLAMSRPTQIAMQQYDILKQFKQTKIKTIINLQSLNEHAFCGPPLLLSGFSYDPEVIMKNNVYYYNFAMPDFGVSNVYSILNIVKVMWFALKQGRVAIHCHAGLGRTCTLIACYLVWSQSMTAADAITYVRSKRKNSIQSMKQIMLVEQLAGIMEKYAVVLPMELGQSIESYFITQNDFIASEEVRKYSHVPKVIFVICDRLLRLIFEKNVRYEMGPEEAIHNVRSCTIGKIVVKWKKAFATKGRAQMRYVVNLFARLSAFPFEKNEAVQTRFQSEVTLVSIDEALDGIDASQLVSLLNYYMDTFKRPFCKQEELISAFERFSPNNTALENTRANATTIDSTGQSTDNTGRKRHSHCNAPWQCLVFYLCNALSYVIGENYEVIVDLIAIWLTNEVNVNVKSAIHNHMRDLFARNLSEQEREALDYKNVA